MLRGIVFTILAAAVACSVTAYDPTGSQQGQQQQTGGASTGTQGSPTPSPPSNPTPPPPSQPAPDPGYADIAMPRPPADMATPSTSPNCTTLAQCCQELQDPNAQQQCMDAVNGLNDGVCAGILQQLENAGYCP